MLTLTEAYQALMATEGGLILKFTESTVKKIAEAAFRVNEKDRKYDFQTFAYSLEHLMDKISFNASKYGGQKIIIDGEYVTEAWSDIVENEDLSRFIYLH